MNGLEVENGVVSEVSEECRLSNLIASLATFIPQWRIFHADTEEHIGRMVKIAFVRIGFAEENISLFRSGRDLLNAIKECDPPNKLLIISEISLYEVDFWKVMKEVKQSPKLRDIPLMALTVRSQDTEVFRAWQSGIDCYLTKPFNPKEVLHFALRIIDSFEDMSDDCPDE